MKTTLRYPARCFGARSQQPLKRGIPFRKLVSEALADKLIGGRSEEKP